MNFFLMPSALRLVRRIAAFPLVAVALHAQLSDPLAPRTPAPSAVAALPAPSEPARQGAASDSAIVVPALRGLVFLPSASALQPQGVAVSGLQITGLPLLDTPEFRAIVTPYLDRPISVGALNGLTREVVLYLRQHGRPVVDVLVPEQAVSTGTVQILVIEGRLGEVRTEGTRYFAASTLTSAVRAQPGAVIEGSPLLADLAWINQNPFRQVDLVFTRGTRPGETDVVLRTRDRYPLRVYGGYEDSGNALTGFDRVLAGVNWGNAFGRDEQLNYQLSASPDFRKLVAHSGSYIMPLRTWRHTLTVFASHARSQPELAGGAFALDGTAWQIGVRYRLPLPERAAWTREVTLGVDFKRSNNNLLFGGAQVFARENDVAQAIASLGASHTDRRGITSGQLTLALSPGGLTAANHRADYEAARTFARPEYGYARLELERVMNFASGFSWQARGTAQWASANLLGSEQLGLGGSSNLRGYEEREANGDNGFVLVNELHGRAMAGLFGQGEHAGRLDPLVFADYGIVTNHTRLAGEPDRLELASAGIGFRLNVGTRFNLKADYGWQMKASGVSDGRRNSRAHVSAIVAF